MQKINLIKVENSDLDQYSDELFKSIKQDKEVYSLLLKQGFYDDIIKKNVSKFNDFRDDYYASKQIKTYSDCIEKNKFYSLKLVNDNGIIERQYDALEPYKDFMIYMSKFIYKDFDDKFNNISWKDVEEKSSGFKAKISKIAKEKDEWIYIYGANRTGKTFAAIAVTNRFAKNHEDICFLKMSKRISELNDYNFHDKEKFNKVIEQYINSSLLVLDGFGEEFMTDYSRDNIIVPILRARAENGLFTIITSTFTIDEIAKLYTSKNIDSSIRVKQLTGILNSKVKKLILTSNKSLY